VGICSAVDEGKRGAGDHSGGINPAAGIQNRLKPIAALAGNLFQQVLPVSGGFKSAGALKIFADRLAFGSAKG
jgi:hypothetical protein